MRRPRCRRGFRRLLRFLRYLDVLSLCLLLGGRRLGGGVLDGLLVFGLGLVGRFFRLVGGRRSFCVGRFGFLFLLPAALLALLLLLQLLELWSRDVAC